MFESGTWFWIIWNLAWSASLLWFPTRMGCIRGLRVPMAYTFYPGFLIWSTVAFFVSWYFWGFWLSLAGGMGALLCLLVLSAHARRSWRGRE